MPLSSLNLSPRSIHLISAMLNCSDDLFISFDIGAAGGAHDLWKPVSNMARVIGFDANREECERLNKLENNMRVFPFVLGESVGPSKFYITNYPLCYGLYPVNDAFLSRFPNYFNNKVIEEIDVETTTIDTFVAEQAIERIDFIKIDAEGAELPILSGGKDALTSRKVLGIITELWWDPCIKGQPSFSELDIFLRDNGFYLFDLECTRYPRTTLPLGALNAIEEEVESEAGPQRRVTVSPSPLNVKYGQILTGDALYLRDPIQDAAAKKGGDFWDKETILRYIGILDLLNYQDMAIEILDFFRDGALASVDVDSLIDSLVPPLCSRVIPFDEYWNMSDAFFKQLISPTHRPLVTMQAPRYVRPENRKKD